MKWFKHMTDAANDEKISALEREHGFAGLGRWWRVLELVAGQMNGSEKCQVTYHMSHWGRVLGMGNRTQVGTYLGTLHRIGLLTLHVDGEVASTSIPNLLKIRARKNLIESKKCRIELEEELEVDKEEEGNVVNDHQNQEIQQVFAAYLESWRKTKKYELTQTRRTWIKNALSAYDLQTCLKAVQKFRNDAFLERARFNGLEYLFGKKDRIDRWCDSQSPAQLSINSRQEQISNHFKKLGRTSWTDTEAKEAWAEITRRIS